MSVTQYSLSKKTFVQILKYYVKCFFKFINVQDKKNSFRKFQYLPLFDYCNSFDISDNLDVH